MTSHSSRACHESERAAVAASLQVGTYCHGERLFQASEHCANVTIVIDGLVRLFRITRDGSETTTAIVVPEGIVATTVLGGCADDDTHAAAIGRVRTIMMPTASFHDLMSRYPACAGEIARALIARTDDTYVNIMADAQSELCDRILHSLRTLARSSRPAGNDEAMLRLTYRLSHAEIARLVGAHRSSVTRALRLLDERGLVRLEHGHVTGVRS